MSYTQRQLPMGRDDRCLVVSELDTQVFLGLPGESPSRTHDEFPDLPWRALGSRSWPSSPLLLLWP